MDDDLVHIFELLGLDPTDPDVAAESEAVERDMRLIEALVAIRHARGLTQAQVARRMDRSQPAVSDFERVGGDPHLSTIRRYARAVGAQVRHVATANPSLEETWEDGGSVVGSPTHASSDDSNGVFFSLSRENGAAEHEG